MWASQLVSLSAFQLAHLGACELVFRCDSITYPSEWVSQSIMFSDFSHLRACDIVSGCSPKRFSGMLKEVAAKREPACQSDLHASGNITICTFIIISLIMYVCIFSAVWNISPMFSMKTKTSQPVQYPSNWKHSNLYFAFILFQVNQAAKCFPMPMFLEEPFERFLKPAYLSCLESLQSPQGPCQAGVEFAMPLIDRPF